MADDSLTDETCAHQPKIHRSSPQQNVGCDVVAMSKSYFNLHISLKSVEKLTRLRVVGHRMAQMVDPAAAHEWRLLSEELDGFFTQLEDL